MAITGEDDVFVAPQRVLTRSHLPSRGFGTGKLVRDWQVQTEDGIAFPYEGSSLEAIEGIAWPQLIRYFWPVRTTLRQRSMFGKTPEVHGLNWYEYMQFIQGRATAKCSVVFAQIASHNHFVLDRGGRVFNCTAPNIKLPADATENDHLALLGLLNSSTAAFWMKQVFQGKGSSGIGRGVYDEAWEKFYSISGTGLGAFPVLDGRTATVRLARELDTLARRILQLSPPELVKQEGPTAERLVANRAESQRLQARIVAFQEELDWLCYRLYGQTGEDDRSLEWPMTEGEPPGLNLGERAFEISLARKVAAGEEQTASVLPKFAWQRGGRGWPAQALLR
jgi:hypothetical protein